MKRTKVKSASKNYPVARGVVPPPGWNARQPIRWINMAAASAVFFGSIGLGWLVFQGPAARLFRSFNTAAASRDPSRPDSNNVNNIAETNTAKTEPPAPRILVKEVDAQNSRPENQRPIAFGQIQGILQTKCANCHSPRKQKGGLDLSSVAAIFKGGDSGPAVVSGKSGDSNLWDAIATDRMPPDKTKRLNASEKELIQRWIDGGAKK